MSTDNWDEMQRQRTYHRLLDVCRKLRDGEYGWEDIDEGPHSVLYDVVPVGVTEVRVAKLPKTFKWTTYQSLWAEHK